MSHRSALATLLGVLLTVGLLSGCSSGNRLTYSGPQDAYKKGVEQYEQENYEKAIRYFRAVFNYGRGNQWAPDAQFKLAMAERERGQYLVAANEFKRFRELYRTDKRVPRAEYERARAHYLQAPPYNLDQTHTRKAISLFQLFIDRYPDHKLVSDAEQKISELRAKLAHKKYDAAEMYERRRMWRAATETYEDVFNQYPDTEWADNALLGAIRSYVRYADRSIEEKQGDRYQQALDHYARLEQLFPNSPLLKQAEPLRAEARRKLRRERQQAADQSLAEDGSPGDAN